MAEVGAATGETQSEYIWLYDLPLAYITNDQIYHVHNDHLGTPQVLTDAAGGTAWEAEYRPFGEAITTGSISFPLRFPVQYHDAETVLHYNWHRYYDPESGRYLTSDPIGLVGGLNPYLYAAANPLYFVDPTGHVGIAGATYGAFSGAIGGYTSSGSLKGTLIGAASGAVVGPIMPGQSYLVGVAAANYSASMAGQFIGNIVADKCVTDSRNYSHLAAVSAGLGSAVIRPVGQGVSKFIDPIPKPVIGSRVGERTVKYTNQKITQSIFKGAAVGFSEKGGFVADEYLFERNE